MKTGAIGRKTATMNHEVHQLEIVLEGNLPVTVWNSVWFDIETEVGGGMDCDEWESMTYRNGEEVPLEVEQAQFESILEQLFKAYQEHLEWAEEEFANPVC